MDRSFDTALACVLRQEGGWSDDPRDPGGPTFRGITLATLAAHRGRPVTPAELRALAASEIAAIYRARYWSAVAADRLPAGLDLAVFDLAVNSGPGRAARLLQAVLGVAEDGRIGPATLAAANRADVAVAVRELGRRRLSFLQRLAAWTAFGRGWSRRVADVEAEALRLVRATPAPSVSTAKDIAMIDTKSILLSRTIWANAIGVVAFGLSVLGFDTKAIDAGGLADAALQIVTAGSFVASSVFRVLATKQLG
jgi:lysozyme family protein